jgi:hypothetical protein
MYPLLFSDFKCSSIFLTGFQKILKYKENLSSGSQGVPCRQMGRHDEDKSLFEILQTRLKNRNSTHNNEISGSYSGTDEVIKQKQKIFSCSISQWYSKISSFHSHVAEDSSSLGRDTVSCFESAMKALRSSEMSETTHPITQCHIPEDLQFQLII